MFSPQWLRETAAKVGYVQRERKIDPVTLFWVLVLGLKREVIDVEIEVSFKSKPKTKKDADDTFETYHPRKPKTKKAFRLVGIFNKESGSYHLYLTTLSPEQLSAEDVALLYRARWSIGVSS